VPTKSAIVFLPMPRAKYHRGDHQPVGLVAHAVGDELAVDLQVVERQVLEVVGTAVEHLLEELGPARLEHLRPVVGAEAPAAHSQFDLVAPAAEDLAPRPTRDALEFGVDDGEAAVAVLA
jgi:hypothetical protein